MNIKNEARTEFDYDLINIENVIAEITDIDFERHYTLNFKVLDFLIENDKFNTKRQYLINQLANESETSLDFIRAFIEREINVKKFINLLCKDWKNIWLFLDHINQIAPEEKEIFYYLILNYAEIEDLQEIENNSSMKFFLVSKSDFLEKIENIDKLKQIIKVFNIRFSNVEFKYTSDDIIEYIYSNNNYAINPIMTKLMMMKFGSYSEKKFNTSNYSSVLESEAENLINYINSNINTYVSSIYLTLENNKEEDSEALLKLLNHSDIELNNRIEVINFTNTLIEDISKIKSVSNLFTSILENSKMTPNWKNVIHVFYEGKEQFSENLIAYLNNSEIANSLSTKVYSTKDEEDTFKNSFLSLDKIEDDLYVEYLEAFSEPIYDIALDGLDEEKVKGLVQKEKLTFSSDTYLKVRELFSPLQIDFAVNNIQKFIDEFFDLDISESEIVLLFKQKNLQDEFKFRILESFTENNEIADIELLTIIGDLYLRHSQQKLSKKVIYHILLESNLDKESKIEIFMKNHSLYDSNFISKFLTALGGKFKELNKKGPMPTFDKTKNLEDFFEYLKSEQYISRVLTQKGNKIKVTTFKI